MADNKAVNQTAAKPEEAKADKKAKANDGKKKVPVSYTHLTLPTN